MNNHFTKLSLLFLISLFCFATCSKNDKEVNTGISNAMMTGKWKITSGSFNYYKADGLLDYAAPVVPGTEYPSEITFSADGKYTASGLVIQDMIPNNGDWKIDINNSYVLQLDSYGDGSGQTGTDGHLLHWTVTSSAPGKVIIKHKVINPNNSRGYERIIVFEK